MAAFRLLLLTCLPGFETFRLPGSMRLAGCSKLLLYLTGILILGSAWAATYWFGGCFQAAWIPEAAVVNSTFPYRYLHFGSAWAATYWFSGGFQAGSLTCFAWVKFF